MNRLLTGLFDLVSWPLWGLGSMGVLVFVSFLSALLALWIFGRYSNQEAIRTVRNRIRGNMLAVRLYRDSVPVVMALQGSIIRDTLTYLKYSLVPLPVLLVPFLLILIQLDLHLQVRPLRPGESAVVKAKFSSALELEEQVRLESPEEIVVETPPVRIAALKEVVWRIRAKAPTRNFLILHRGDQRVPKEVIVGDNQGAVTALRAGNLMDMLLNPGEAPIQESAEVESIQIHYPQRDLSLFGWNIHWMILFFVFSMVFAFALKGVVGVEI
jgi:hypothetical protein